MITESELYNIKGGAIRWVIIGAIGVIVTFAIGLIDGYLRPLKCNN